MASKINAPETSPFRVGPLCLVAVAFVMVCLPMTASTLPLAEILRLTLERVAVRSAECARPHNVQDLFEQVNSGLSDNLELLRPATLDNKIFSIPNGQKGVLVHDPDVNTTCPDHVTRAETASLTDRSLCPFYQDVLVLPDGYYPRALNYVMCKCQDCVEHLAFGCEPVSTPITVLKPSGCYGGLQNYEQEVINIHTSCTCAVRGRNTEVEDLPYSDATVAQRPSGREELQH